MPEPCKLIILKMRKAKKMKKKEWGGGDVHKKEG
jgi:hypothetical protein